MLYFYVFFFKQKTAYEMRISDWSSDVCSSDLTRGAVAEVGKALGLPRDLTKMLTGLVWGWSVDGIPDEQIASLNLNADDHRLKLTLDLARKLFGDRKSTRLNSSH